MTVNDRTKKINIEIPVKIDSFYFEHSIGNMKYYIVLIYQNGEHVREEVTENLFKMATKIYSGIM